MKEKKKAASEIFVYILIIITTILTFYCVKGFWNWDMNVPISFGGDTLTDGGTLSLAKKAIRGEGILSTKSFWTVGDSNIAWGIIDASIHYWLMRLLAIFIHSVGSLTNIYFIITFALCGCFMYYSLTRLKIRNIIAFVVSITYAFLPGHLLRGVSHLAIGSCFALPLMVLGCIYLVNDSISTSDKFSIRIFGKKIYMNRNLTEGMVGAALVGFSSIYFGAFSMIVHALSGFISFLDKKRINIRYAAILLLTDLTTIFFTVVFPNFISAGSAVGQWANTRVASDIDVYGMKIAQLILPVSGHRIAFLSNLRNIYSTAFGENENAGSSLGLFFSVAFIISIIYLFVDNEKDETQKNIKQIGKLNLMILMISVVGGVSELVGLLGVTSFIRCYNRMSFIIACLSAVVLGLLLEKVIKNKKPYGQYICCLCLLVISIFDQTGVNTKISPEEAEYYKNIWETETAFFNKLENQNIRNVLIYPSKYSSKYKSELYLKYEVMKSYLHTDNIRFTTGYQEGSDTDLWIKSLENYTDEEILKISSAVGFDGILLYKNGFRDESAFMDLCGSFVSLLGGHNVISSDDGQWYYFPISEYVENVKKWDQQLLNNVCRQLGSNRIRLNKEYMFGHHEIEPYLMGGFSQGEVDFRWSLGKSSIIKFVINEESYGDIDATLNYLNLYSMQDIEVEVNDRTLPKMALTGYNNSFTIRIPRESIKNGEVILRINYSNPESPASRGEGEDKRKLAVAWKSIVLEDTKENIEHNQNYIDMNYLEEYLGR